MWKVAQGTDDLIFGGDPDYHLHPGNFQRMFYYTDKQFYIYW